MFTEGPTAAELALWGLLPSDIAAVELWADNVPIYELFEFMSSQWRSGAAGVIGLDYNVAYRRLDRMNLDPDDYDDRIDGMRVMEFAALAALAEARDKAREK